MQLYEDDYDNFLDKLRDRRKKKKQEAENKKAEAEKAGQTLSEAETYKKKHLGQKAQELIDKAGGIEGAKDTIQNVMKYFKAGVPADYQVDIGKEEETKEKKILGLPAGVVFVGGTVLFLGFLFMAAKMMHKPVPLTQPKISPLQQAPLQQAA